MEHTPGPWTVDDNYIKCRFDGRQNNVCRMLGRGDETEANAHLIAAAPDLLQACKAVIEWVNIQIAVDSSEHCFTADEWALWQMVQAAIAKAEGE